MGKIEDAIGKVQRERQARAEALRREDTAAIEVVNETVPIRKVWDYGGRKLVFDRRRLIDAGLLDSDYMRKHLTAEYRQLKHAILNRAADVKPRGNLVMICAAESGNGASFLSLNLAMSLAADPLQSIVLIDANQRSPALSEKVAGLKEPGLSELLVDERADANSLICPTDVPGLAFLPVGKPPAALDERLSGERADELFGELAAADPSRIVLIDAEPVQESITSRRLAGMLGQTMLVVRSGTTARGAVVEALQLIGNERPAGIVINAFVPEPRP